MDEAINNARGESSSEPEDTINKTKKQYFKQKYTGHRNARLAILIKNNVDHRVMFGKYDGCIPCGSM